MLTWLRDWAHEIDKQLAGSTGLQVGDRVALRDPLIRRIGRTGRVVRAPRAGLIGGAAVVEFDEPGLLRRSRRQRVAAQLLVRLDSPPEA